MHIHIVTHPLLTVSIVISPELTVYRYSRQRLVEYLMKKVDRLHQMDIVARSPTLTRELAKDGLTENGKDDLLKGLASTIFLDNTLGAHR